MKQYIICRFICFGSLLLIFVGAILLYFQVLDDRAFAIVSGILAIIVPVAGIFAIEPVEPIDFETELNKIKGDLDTDLATRLSQKEALNEYINNQSNELLLMRLKKITEDAIISRYRDSDISHLIEELNRIEVQLDALNIKYETIDLPDRFKLLIESLKRQDDINAYIDVMGSIPFFGRSTAAILRFHVSRGLLTKALLDYQRAKSNNKNSKSKIDNKEKVLS